MNRRRADAGDRDAEGSDPPVLVAPVSPAAVTDTKLDEWHALWCAIRRNDLPGDTPPPRSQTPRLLWPTGDEERCVWAAHDHSGRLRGYVILMLPGHENSHVADLTVGVHPESRHGGIGQLLYSVAAGYARREGRTTALGAVRQGGPGARFCATRGLRVVHEGVRSFLRTAEIDQSDVDSWAGGAEARTDGYTLVRWVGRCPDDLVESFAAAGEAMNDAPAADADLRLEAHTVERVRRQEAAMARFAERRHTLAVRHDASGHLAGYTQVDVNPDTSNARQLDTSVLAAHRGRGFGLWLKAGMLRWLADTEPHVAEYETMNAPDNTHMLAVNERLGYRPVDVWNLWTGPLS